jgi:hypothetical protein
MFINSIIHAEGMEEWIVGMLENSTFESNIKDKISKRVILISLDRCFLRF